MISRRGFFGALAGAAAVASTKAHAHERNVAGWDISWSGWREPINQNLKLGFWWARRDPMPESFPDGMYPCYYSTTLGSVGCAFPTHVIDTTREDRNAPWFPHEDPKKFEAAKAWARKRLIEKLESL